MLFLVNTPKFNKIQLNTTKVKVHLRNGIAEILDQHSDLMGLVENNLLEIETYFENKLEKFLYILQDGVFVVATKGLNPKSLEPEKAVEIKGTGVYIYARRACEVNSNTSIEELTKEYEQQNAKLQKQIAKLESLQTEKEKKEGKPVFLTSRSLLLKGDVEFLRRTIVILKDFKNFKDYK
jgi:hypothetical protein